MKQNLRNISVFGIVGLAAVALVSGCSDDAEKPLGGGFSGSSSTAGTFSSGGTGTSGSATTGGTATSGSATTGGGGSGTTGGTFGTSGTGTGGAGTGGTFGTGGTTGGTAAGGGGTGGTAAGGGGTGGTAAGGGGAGGGTNGDFPANCPAPTGTHGTTPLTRTCWVAKASDCAATAQNMNPPKQAIDAAGAETRFSTGAKMLTSQAFTFEIDLGTAVMVNGVQVVSKAGTLDFATALEVSVSTDGTTFTPVACGPGDVTTDFSFTATSARYVRLVQHGTADGWWSIHDLNVYSSTGDTCAGGGTQTDMCTNPHTT